MTQKLISKKWNLLFRKQKLVFTKTYLMLLVEVTSEVAGVSRQVEGVGKEVLNDRFATERGLCDLGYKTNSDIRDSRDQMGLSLINKNNAVWKK